MKISYYKGSENVSERYPAEMFGIECGNGWNKLIEPIIEYISKENKKREQSGQECIHIIQIKEKFGRLRIYLSDYTEELRQMLADAEDKSWSVCEECGSETDIVHTSGWVTTLCRKCFEQKNKNVDGYLKIMPEK